MASNFADHKKYLSILLTVLLLGLSQFARADFLGVYIGAGGWNHDSTGQITGTGTDVDLENNFGLEKDFSGFSYIAVEHPFPLVPNIRLNQYAIESSKSTTLTATSAFNFAGTSYTAGTTVQSDVEWDENDTLLYYEFLDNIVSFDAGLGMKSISAKFSVTSAGTTNTLSIEEDMPIAYMMAGAHIPGTGISFIVEQTQSFLGDMDISQTSTKISYETSFMLGLEIGHRTSTANLNDLASIDGEVKFSGPFANLLFHF